MSMVLASTQNIGTWSHEPVRIPLLYLWELKRHEELDQRIDPLFFELDVDERTWTPAGSSGEAPDNLYYTGPNWEPTFDKPQTELPRKHIWINKRVKEDERYAQSTGEIVQRRDWSNKEGLDSPRPTLMRRPAWKKSRDRVEASTVLSKCRVVLPFWSISESSPLAPWACRAYWQILCLHEEAEFKSCREELVPHCTGDSSAGMDVIPFRPHCVVIPH